jgi:hypothetical protein
MDTIAASPSAAIDLNMDAEQCVEYLFYPNYEQAALLRRWFGHVRSIHNAAFNYFQESPEVNTAIGKLVRYVAQSKFLMELPSSALGEKISLVAEECEEFTIEHHTTRKQDVQVIGLHGDDFELTARATVVVKELGELDIEFNEGPPAPNPTSIELVHDPLSGHQDSIRLYYSKGAANNG